MDFKIHSKFKMTGDQPEAVEKLVNSIKAGNKYQTLKGVTGSGKTFTMANIIEQTNLPTLVIAHNKTLAYQLCMELRNFFPENSVEYFVSYYDYYQPEAYVPSTDTYIAKDSAINDEIDKLRHSATAALFERRDVIIVASVSCIYGLGDPEDYLGLMVSLRPGMQKDRDEVIKELTAIQYVRNDVNFIRGTFRVRGDVLDIFPSSESENSIRVEFWGDEIDKITSINHMTGEILGELHHASIFPASHFATSDAKVKRAIVTIEDELEDRLKELRDRDHLLYAERLEQRTRYDLEMLREIGFCSGIENYSRHLSGRAPDSRPYTLIDYFPEDFLIIADESHVTIPQVRGMYAGDRSRKQTLVDYGFRLPSALDNRPLNFNEFESLIKHILFVSATPGAYELEKSEVVAEQILRPTGLLDPKIIVRPIKNQIDDLLSRINARIANNERVLITTLTKKMAEDLTDYLKNLNIKVSYMHSDTETIDRMKIIKDLRTGEIDVLVGINLLREGLDLPEVSLVAILDADKEGFLRSETSLIQTVGRAARNANGEVVMYADRITDSIKTTIEVTERRRAIQNEYNIAHNITPKSIVKDVREVIGILKENESIKTEKAEQSAGEIESKIRELKANMLERAEKLDFEAAAEFRDEIKKLENKLYKMGR
ncbi:MAG: excinuclease ABC subunit UvrB [Ezakiella sp.]|nr:excinuclease ABC subunit UvrB [Ezakiella sp.]MDD7472240.1 excinuclease ABC subunit UvrB [Bacillota bacterium]MDY3923759.1 excinuclease ABC subunit UvrB [Ezakiella sp.]